MKNDAPRYVLTPHVCKECNGRILQQVSPPVATGGGNPLFRCADCGKAASGMFPKAICYCGFHFSNQPEGAYRCVPFADNEHLREELAITGYSRFGTSEIGVVAIGLLKRRNKDVNE